MPAPLPALPFLPRRAALILAATFAGALLGSCDFRERHAENRQTQLKRANAQHFLTECIEALERTRVYPTSGGRLPAGLDGQPCDSPLLGDYAMPSSDMKLLRRTEIRLDDDRLSAYTLTVTSLDGERFTYRDRGTAEAAAEQAGTFTPSRPATQAQQDEAAEQIGEDVGEGAGEEGAGGRLR